MAVSGSKGLTATLVVMLFFCSAAMASPIVEPAKGVNGLDTMILRQPTGASAEVYLYGAQVTSWKNDQGEELLFVSSKAIFEPPTAIRGGIPICFPQFSGLGTLPSHGFARNRIWIIDTNPPPPPTDSTSTAYVDLLLTSSEEDMKIWPNSYEYRLRVALGPEGNLVLTSVVKNTNADGPFSFTFAYHNYFSVSDISGVQVQGLENLDYLDNTQNRTRATEQGAPITIAAEVDRVYLNPPKEVTIVDNDKKRTFIALKEGLADAVVWNPWAKTIKDLGAEDYKLMVCVEAAAIDKPITLNPGEEWIGTQELSASFGGGQADARKVLRV